MDNKNILLGYGETLTENVDLPPPSGGKKSHPYTYIENKAYVIGKVKSLLAEIDTIPQTAKPNDQSVIKFVLHPSYLAKSYFPAKLFNKFSLRSIGSKSTRIKPRKKATVSSKDIMIAWCIYVAGKKESFQGLLHQLENEQLPKGIKDDIIKIENIELLDSVDKIKNISSENKRTKMEVALHTPPEFGDLLSSFVKHAQLCNAEVEVDKKISIDGLTFLPVTVNSDDAKQLAEYSFLRAIRDLPKIRTLEPVAHTSSLSTRTVKLPTEAAINSDIKVAVFDCGVGFIDFEPWCEEVVFDDSDQDNTPIHGQDVTSTILFGLIDKNQQNLPVPYSNIKHFKVIDESIPLEDNDLFSVLHRIKSVLDNEKFDFINLSLGPHICLEDDEVNVWTSTLESYLCDGQTLCTVAVGNDGLLEEGLNRIQPPSDMVNALAVGSSTSYDEYWEKSPYSCVGPGRSPGFIKPDGLAFGGASEKPFTVYNPALSGISETYGTSLSAPLVLRQAIGIAASLDHEITPLTCKALLIHHATSKTTHKTTDVGYGLFPHSLNEVIYCADNETKVIYQGVLKPSQNLRALIPFPDLINGDVTLKATFCFNSSIEPQHPINYTRNGLQIVFRHKFGEDQTKTKSFFNLKNTYSTEQEQRKDSHKWELTLHREQTFRKSTLNNPCFDIVYQAREGGQSVNIQDIEPLPYVLIVSVKAKNSPNLYNNILQKYQSLQPIKLEQRIKI